MNLLVSPLPLFNGKMEVMSYYFASQKGNSIITLSQQASALDGCFGSLLLDLINELGLEALSLNKPIFVEITNILLSLDLQNYYKYEPDKIIFVLDKEVSIEEEYLYRIKNLKMFGYKICMRNVEDIVFYEPLLKIVDYVIFNKLEKDLEKKVQILKYKYKDLKVMVNNILSNEEYDYLKKYNIDLFYGKFYKIPITNGKNKMAILKSNYIQLLNLLNEEDFELDEFSKILQQDPALVISFLRMINSNSTNSKNPIKTIKHAAVILGQNEIKKWITTAVTNSLSEDKPNEITRLSLLRARFAENLAGKFSLGIKSSNLFLMGLFSVLDVVLEMDIEDALNIVQVSPLINQALVNHKGEFYPVYELILYYEMGDWQNVSRILILNNISVSDIFDLYIDSIKWYNKLINWKDEEEK